MIKQILTQKDDIMSMWGMEYKMITTVAVVRNIDHSSTKITYQLEDLSGEEWRKSSKLIWDIPSRIVF